MQPINYMLDVQNPVQMALQGYLQGKQIQSAQQGMEIQRQQMEMQRQEFEAAQAQIAQQQARAQEVQALMGQFGQMVQEGTVTPEDVIQMQMMVPEMADSIKGSWDILSEGQKNGKITDYSRLAIALKRNPEIAMELIDERLAAAENSGDPQQAQVMRAIKQQAEMNPAGVLSSVLMELATVMPDAEFKNFMSIAMPQSPEAASVEGKIMQDFQRGVYGDPNSQEAKSLLAQALERARGPQTVVNVGGELSPGFKKRDELFAQIALDWDTGGGSDALKQLAQIEDVIGRIDAGEDVSGGVTGFAPDLLRALADPNAQDAKDTVEEVVQRNLRVILGAQFTAKEGEQLIARAFNPRLKPEINRKRLQRLFTQMRIAAEQKQAMTNYFNENGTLQGYQGQQPTVNDFYAALETEGAPAAQDIPVVTNDSEFEALPSGAVFVDETGKRYRKP